MDEREDRDGRPRRAPPTPERVWFCLRLLSRGPRFVASRHSHMPTPVFSLPDSGSPIGTSPSIPEHRRPLLLPSSDIGYRNQVRAH